MGKIFLLIVFALIYSFVALVNGHQMALLILFSGLIISAIVIISTVLVLGGSFKEALDFLIFSSAEEKE